MGVDMGGGGWEIKEWKRWVGWRIRGGNILSGGCRMGRLCCSKLWYCFAKEFDKFTS